jgi:tetratricopeptide (TPR) repeat protein
MNNKDYSQIDQILDEIIIGKSSEEKLADLISGYTSEELINELQAHKTAAAAIQRSAVISQVSLVHQSFFERRNGFTKEDISYAAAKVVKRNFKYWWSAAAILIVVPALVFMFTYITNSPARLFASQYQTYSMNVDRSSDPVNNEPLAKDYQDKKYSDVIREFRGLATQTVTDKMITAFAYMELNNYEAAIPLLEGVIRSNGMTGTKLYQDEAEYYLALSYLKSKQVEQSYQLFKKIYIDEEHTFNGRVDKWFMMKLNWLRQHN